MNPEVTTWLLGPQALQLLFAEEAGDWYAASASPALHQSAATAYDALLAARYLTLDAGCKRINICVYADCVHLIAPTALKTLDMLLDVTACCKHCGPEDHTFVLSLAGLTCRGVTYSTPLASSWGFAVSGSVDVAIRSSLCLCSSD